jgi:hypothetical protein
MPSRRSRPAKEINHGKNPHRRSRHQVRRECLVSADRSRLTEAATALIDACDAETVELDDVVQAQVYTAISDPAGAANAAPGDCVDVTFRPGATPQQLRAGEAAAVPAAIATARDAFKTAVEAAL